MEPQIPRLMLDSSDWTISFRDLSSMGLAIHEHDWSATPLGPTNEWSAALRTAVAICLSSRFPMMVAWGPSLVKIYNDGYRPMLGTTKHPGSLGRPAIEVWPEIWHEIGPMFHTVMQTAQSTWQEHQLLVLERNGFPEECFFTYSFSPLFDGPEIAGVLCVAVETSEQIISARRLTTVAMLASRLAEGQRVIDVCLRALDALAVDRTDIRGADVYLVVEDALSLIASNRRGDVAPLDADDLRAVIDDGPFAVGHVDDTVPARHYAMPLGGSGNDVRGVLVVSLHPQIPFDVSYRAFLRLIADALSSALDGAHGRTVELGELRHVGDVLQAAMLKPASDLPTVAARYLPAVGSLAVGGDWYDVIDLGDDKRGLVVGDCVGHGLEAATVMAQLRTATRALLFDSRDPAKVLDQLDRFVSTVDAAYCTSVVCAVFDRQVGTLTYSRAGHPPPLLVTPDAVIWLDQAGGPPLGVDVGLERSNAHRTHGGEDMLVLYSDGLIERRHEDLAVGLDRLGAAASQLRGSTVQDFADGLLRELLPENTRDDVVLVVKQLHLNPRRTDGAR